MAKLQPVKAKTSPENGQKDGQYSVLDTNDKTKGDMVVVVFGDAKPSPESSWPWKGNPYNSENGLTVLGHVANDPQVCSHLA